MKYFDVIIVGAGVAGMTAGIYAKRAGKSVLILEGKAQGGQIINTFGVANWPGEEKISGVDLTEKIYHQTNKLGAEFEYEEVVEISQSEECVEGDSEKHLWNVKTEDGEYSCGAIVIASGSVERKMEVPGEEKYIGRGVSFCATCDGAFYKDKAVAVVGGGNTAFYDALYLADLCSKVYLVHRRNKFRADSILVDKLKARENVEFVTPFVPSEVKGDKKVTSLVLVGSNVDDNGEEDVDPVVKEIEVDGVFVAVGRIPATGFLKDVVDLDAGGYVKAGEDCKTSTPGIFVAGDCRTKDIRQLVTAVSDGAVAATEACRYLG